MRFKNNNKKSKPNRYQLFVYDFFFNSISSDSSSCHHNTTITPRIKFDGISVSRKNKIWFEEVLERKQQQMKMKRIFKIKTQDSFIQK